MEIKDFSAFLKGPVDKLLGAVGNELKQSFSNRLLEYQVEEYKRNFYSKTLLHRSEPKPLYEFYQPLYITKAQHESEKISTSSAKKLFGHTTRQKYKNAIVRNQNSDSIIILASYHTSKEEDERIAAR